jgi:VWFA-related protein
VQVRTPAAEEARIEPNSVEQSRQMAADPRARVFVVFLDTYHTQIEGSANMRLPLVKFLDRVLGPDDLVAVMTPEMSAADVAFGRKTTVISNIMQNQWTWGRRGNLLQEDPKELLYAACYGGDQPLVQEMKERRRERLTLDSLEDLVTHLGGIREERKAVITVTEGWRLFTPNRNLAERTGGQGPSLPPIFGRNPKDRGQRTVETPGVSRTECDTDRQALAAMDDSMRIRDLTEHANRANVSFYPVYARGLAVFDGPITEPVNNVAADQQRLRVRQDALRVLASDTDGLAVTNTNDIDGALARIVADLSSYYLLGYYSTNTRLDGRFRSITVRVKRPGVQVRARRGYRALTAEEILGGSATPGVPTAAEAAVSSALNAVSGVDSRAPFRIRASSWLPPASADGAASGIVWIVGELDFRTRRELAWTSGATADLAVVAGDGTTVVSRAIEISPTEGTFAIRVPDRGGVAAGEYAVRVRARPAGDGSLPVSDIARVQVPERPSALGQAVLWRRGPSTGLRYLMTADPRFQRTERIRLELPTRAAGQASARMVDRAGKTIQVPVQVSERQDAGNDFRWLVVDATLAPLAPGDYAIEVSLDGAKQVTGFRLVP